MLINLAIAFGIAPLHLLLADALGCRYRRRLLAIAFDNLANALGKRSSLHPSFFRIQHPILSLQPQRLASSLEQSAFGIQPSTFNLEHTTFSL